MTILRALASVLLSLPLSLTACAAPGAEPQGGTGPARCDLEPGQRFPAFSLNDTAGKRVTHKVLQGPYTVVVFYFADCPPCLYALPQLAALPARLPGLRFLAMTPEPLTVAREIADQYGFRWTTLAEAGRTIRAVGVADYPSIALVGPDGRLAAVDSFARILAGGESVAHWIERVGKERR